MFVYRKRLTNVRLENSALSKDRAIFISIGGGIYQEGYVYHIKDESFEKVQYDKLMQKKENDTYRPTFFCLRDPKTSLLWMVPLSSRVEKFKAIHDKQVAKYGKCLTIVLGEFDGKKSSLLAGDKNILLATTDLKRAEDSDH